MSELPSFFRNSKKLELHKKLCENKDFCNVIMLSEDTKILEFNQYRKSDKAPFIIYADLECMTEKIDGCKNNPENSSTTEISKHIPSGFSMPAISSFRSIENIINEVLRRNFRPFYFFYEEILHTKKHKKQISDFHSDIFIRLKSIKSKQMTFTHKKHKTSSKLRFRRF